MRWVMIGAVLLCVASFVAACGGGETTAATSAPDGAAATASGPAATTSAADDAPGPTEVFGTALPRFEQLEDDPAVGRTPPVIVGTDLLTGDVARITTRGRPMVIAFYAHWCPHCQAEVADLTEWLETNELPSGVDFYAVSVLEDAARGNHPPEEWLRDEGWQYPVVADTPAMSVVDAFGLVSVPYLVAVDADNEVVLRFAGNVGPAELAAFFTALLEPTS
ncbi:MAG: TlpA family protein disulfide reductase [Acidimicrobiales bacterium]|nr:TlpA family protein disulfide reductase [Acidimicrobiales bacterium]MXX41643.1 TlpA family protein disulfide reductase [Acidimicrobiales bacterium]MYA83106.1 TlpA family protein disulfide reductase [Acidimicrobiales bacterium]MYB81823.1 TlpA family protein disulfide reductase [Acidimicrobiales bacterium]MYH73392.1 TlpA family protein disulfide reductase [Acidimicrobiales bacterium]